MPYKKNIFDPDSTLPFKISRSKIDLFLECPRCFYLDIRLGVKRPQTPAFTLNVAVDALLKNEFDILRGKKESHKLMKEYGIDAVPLDHKDLPLWRGEVERFSGIKILHKDSNLIVDGLVDDVWVNKDGEFIIVDYKATSTEKEISLDDEYKQGYKTQMEIYQWIFRESGFKVSDNGYFVFANAIKNKISFDAKLEFEMTIIKHVGNSSWVPGVLLNIKTKLISNKIPEIGDGCKYCLYRESAGKAFKEVVLSSKKENVDLEKKDGKVKKAKKDDDGQSQTTSLF